MAGLLDDRGVVPAYRRALESVLEAVLGRVATAVDAAGRAADAAYATVSAALRASRWIALHVVVAVIVGAVCLAAAIGIYALAYSLYIPTLSHTFPVYFQFDPAGAQMPTAVVDFTGGVQRRFLHRNQAYDILVDLNVPTSPENKQAGMFMVGVALQSYQNVTIHHAERPAIVPYQSRFLRYLSTLTFALPLVTGWMGESCALEIGVLDLVADDPDYVRAITKAEVRLSKPTLQVYSASLKMYARFSGLRYLMHSWFFTTATVVVGTLFFWEFLIATAIYVAILRRLTARSSSGGGGGGSTGVAVRASEPRSRASTPVPLSTPSRPSEKRASAGASASAGTAGSGRRTTEVPDSPDASEIGDAVVAEADARRRLSAGDGALSDDDDDDDLDEDEDDPSRRGGAGRAGGSAGARAGTSTDARVPVLINDGAAPLASTSASADLPTGLRRRV